MLVARARLGAAFLALTALPASGAAVARGYRVVHGWPVLPENTMLDEVSAVAVDSRGDVFVLTRGGRKWPDSGDLDPTLIAAPTIHVFDGRTGALKKELGRDLFALPHSITVDDEDNVWVADVALHQVLKLSATGQKRLEVGERGVPGEDRAHFNRPSDVAVDKDGSFYVSDGYGNSRIVKFSSAGKYLLSWGTRGKEPGQLDLPHSLALDPGGRVYVVDRTNNRIQVFDPLGKYVTQWTSKQFANPQAVRVSSKGKVYVMNAGTDALPDRAGVAIFRADGSFVERFGRFGNYDGQFVDGHWLALSRDGDVYVADFAGKRVQKFHPRRADAAAGSPTHPRTR
jgi:peptidylamidoglycolate lyase